MGYKLFTIFTFVAIIILIAGCSCGSPFRQGELRESRDFLESLKSNTDLDSDSVSR